MPPLVVPVAPPLAAAPAAAPVTPLEALLELFCTCTMGTAVGCPLRAATPWAREFPRATLEPALLAEDDDDAKAEDAVALPW